ncbi:NADH dehydrogenase [ubiquinone] 1 alpha subcomplex subunit 1 [Procambarus clarkii]|uniref:NADH dehydrogenase [ubiquinone] 1 alpha subcomplex subunit 1 n=1 Tax=Procambarus clarkii TaxID=6728 RepID=UPI001E673D62|nr:NADH dehydrogenase [ubiquinone] 1 alpha subcomplex subunit 1-like [Procambarus clarkii]
MWFNIIPSFLLVAGCLGVPAIANVLIHKLVYNNIYQRELVNERQRFLFLRDGRLSGNPFRPLGLETIPDEEPTE